MLRFGLSLALACAMCLPPALAQDEESRESEPTHEPTEETRPIVPILAGETAPWSGLLVPEATFIEYLQLGLRVKELEGLLEIRTNLINEQDNIYRTAIRESFADAPGWWDRNAFTIGIISGILIGTTAAILGVWVADGL